MKSDLSDLDLVTEIIREKLFRRFNKELPYSFEQENVYVCLCMIRTVISRRQPFADMIDLLSLAQWLD